MDSGLAELETVMIVDDSLTGLKALGNILKEAGYKVLAIQDSLRIVTLVKAKKPDILLLDVMMPGVDGFDVCKEIVQSPDYNNLPIIFLTAKTKPEDIQKGFEVGAVDYMTKPYSKIELLQRLRNHLDRRKHQIYLEREKERLKMLTESVEEAFLLVEEKSLEILYFNPALKTILDEFPDDASYLDTLLEFFLPQENRDIVMHKIRARGPFLSEELRLVMKDSTIRWVSLRMSRQIVGGIVHQICVLQNITDRKIAEMKLIESIEQEKDLAGSIQKSLLMNEFNVSIPGIEFVIFSEPSKKIDGDFFDLYDLDETMDVVVGDVMGKGILAALIGAAAKTRLLRAHAIMNHNNCQTKKISSPVQIMEYVNNAMAKQLLELNSFYTLQYLRFARKESFLEFIDCGHTPLLVWDGSECWVYKGTSLPIGFLEKQPFRSFRIPLEPGHLCLVYSDGITEATSPDGDQLGEELLIDIIRKHAHSGPDALVDTIKTEVQKHLNYKKPDDDITLAAFAIGPEPEIPKARYSRFIDFSAKLEHLETIRQEVRKLLSSYSTRELGEKARELTVLSTSEAASNVIIHGLVKNPERVFRLTLTSYETWYCITFRYKGSDFDWARDRKPSVLAMDERGYGMYIMQNSIHSLTHARSDSGLFQIILSGTLEGGGYG